MIFHIKLRLVQKPWSIRSGNVDGFIRVYDGTRYLVKYKI